MCDFSEPKGHEISGCFFRVATFPEVWEGQVHGGLVDVDLAGSPGGACQVGLKVVFAIIDAHVVEHHCEVIDFTIIEAKDLLNGQ